MRQAIIILGSILMFQCTKGLLFIAMDVATDKEHWQQLERTRDLEDQREFAAWDAYNAAMEACDTVSVYDLKTMP